MDFRCRTNNRKMTIAVEGLLFILVKNDFLRLFLNWLSRIKDCSCWPWFYPRDSKLMGIPYISPAQVWLHWVKSVWQDDFSMIGFQWIIYVLTRPSWMFYIYILIGIVWRGSYNHQSNVVSKRKLGHRNLKVITMEVILVNQAKLWRMSRTY